MLRGLDHGALVGLGAVPSPCRGDVPAAGTSAGSLVLGSDHGHARAAALAARKWSPLGEGRTAEGRTAEERSGLGVASPCGQDSGRVPFGSLALAPLLPPLAAGKRTTAGCCTTDSLLLGPRRLGARTSRRCPYRSPSSGLTAGRSWGPGTPSLGARTSRRCRDEGRTVLQRTSWRLGERTTDMPVRHGRSCSSALWGFRYGSHTDTHVAHISLLRLCLQHRQKLKTAAASDTNGRDCDTRGRICTPGSSTLLAARCTNRKGIRKHYAGTWIHRWSGRWRVHTFPKTHVHCRSGLSVRCLLVHVHCSSGWRNHSNRSSDWSCGSPCFLFYLGSKK